ncbi:hypothetical protein BH09BAC6_BH09BAC6_08720 [soil metagenome]|jgi:hypothetical protein
MKKLIFSAAIILSCFAYKAADAQVRVNLGLNFNSQPAYGRASYYYMPDINAYYSVPTREYIYYDNDGWVRANYLPERYGNYDVYHNYRVAVNERNPWFRNQYYQSRYAHQYRERREHEFNQGYNGYNNERYRGHWDNGRHNGWGRHDGDGDEHRHHRDND